MKGGRCEECQGEGTITTQLYFMPDVEVTCSACKGARFNSETLEVTLRGKTIDDVLNMSVEEGVTFFAEEPTVRKKIQVLAEPTTGLHLADVARLLESLNRLVDAGHTVILIEHHMDVIKTADHIIDFGAGWWTRRRHSGRSGDTGRRRPVQNVTHRAVPQGAPPA